MCQYVAYANDTLTNRWLSDATAEHMFFSLVVGFFILFCLLLFISFHFLLFVFFVFLLYRFFLSPFPHIQRGTTLHEDTAHSLPWQRICLPQQLSVFAKYRVL